MLATQLNNVVANGDLKPNSIIKIKGFMANKVQHKTLVILLELEVLERDVADRIGSPAEMTMEMAGIKDSPDPAVSAKPMYNRTNLPNSNNPYGSKPNPSPTRSSSSNPYTSSSSNNNAFSSPTAPIVRSSVDGVSITPISQLNIYQNRWTIKARVTSKSEIRSWSNARGDGTLFSVELLDSSGVDVKCTFFKEAVDKFYGMLEMNTIYTFSGGRMKVANPQYNSCKSQYEITFDANAEIHLQNDDGEIQAQLYDFVKLAALEDTEAGKVVDVLCVVKTVAEPVQLVSKKSGQDLTKCDLTVVDDSGVDINLTLWGEKARTAPQEFGGQPICAFRRVRISDYGGKSLSATTNGAAICHPTVPEAQPLQQWWDSGGANATRSLSSSSSGGAGKMEALVDRKDIATIKNQHLGHGEKPDWLSFKATVTFIKKDKEGGAWYTACANADEPCKNRFKVTQTTDNSWFCDKCQNTYPNCVRRWIFSATIADDTSTTWVSFFNEQAETLFGGGLTADQVYTETFDAETGGNQDQYDSYFAKANHTDWIVKCKVKQEMMGDESRVKASVYSLHPVNYAKESRDMLDAIAKF